MAAIAIPPSRHWIRWPDEAAAARRPVSRPTAAVYRRRRAVALILLCAMVAAIALALQAVLGGLGGGPLTTSGPSGTGAMVGVLQPAALRTYTVQPGDTLWSIARGLSGGGDPRPIVDRLMAQRQGRPLQVGERIALP